MSRSGFGRVGENVLRALPIALGLARAHDRRRVGRLAQIAHGRRELRDVVDAVRAHRDDGRASTSGSHTRPASAPLVPSLGSVACRRHVIRDAAPLFPPCST